VDATDQAARDVGSAAAAATSQAGGAVGSASGATLDPARKLGSGYELKGTTDRIGSQLIEFVEITKPPG
jgi:hypothetical protein